jgi:hypothetical protein
MPIRVRAGEDRANLYDEITDKIIAELEARRVPWVQPWGTAATKAPLAMPKNASTDRFYSGINVLILWGAVIERGFLRQSWLTFRQALSLGGHVKGERGTTVVYADRFIPGDEKRRAAESGEEAQAIPFLKRFTVLGARYIGASFGDDQNTFENSGSTLVDAMVDYDMGKLDRRFSGPYLRVNARNLFDKHYQSCQSGFCYAGERRHCLVPEGGRL